MQLGFRGHFWGGEFSTRRKEMNNAGEAASRGASGQTMMTQKTPCEFESVRWAQVCDPEEGGTGEGDGGSVAEPCTDWLTVSDFCRVVNLTAS